jgi:glycosyltransferase involved in cell wall biosynthesis
VTEVLFILETPTPQRTPTLDAIYSEGVDLTALYYTNDTRRGWGEVSMAHPSRAIPRGQFGAATFLAKLILSGKTRVLCCFGYNRPSNIVAVLLARATGIQVITRSDSNWHDEQSRPKFRRRIKRLLLGAIYGPRTRVWTIGSQNDLFWSNMGLKNRLLIPYDVPVPPIGHPSDRAELRKSLNLGSAATFLSVSVLEEWKGIRTLLAAFRSLKDQSARLLIAGKGNLEDLVKEAAAADNRIEYLGPVPHSQLGAIYAAADILVLASHREPWGLVINEAQANGLRIIASDAVGAATDKVDSSNGWVFEAGNEAGLLKALEEACNIVDAGVGRLPTASPYQAYPAMLTDLMQFGIRRSPQRLSDPMLVHGFNEH